MRGHDPRGLDLVGCLRGEVEELAGELEQPRYRGRQLFRWVQARRETDFGAMTDLSLAFRERLPPVAYVGRPEVSREQRARDGTRKFLLRLEDDEEIEGVLIPDEDRLTACISTQVGCPLACRFCLTGLMGIRRNLRAAEIVGEVLALQDALGEGERISNIVLMGMGEPLLNFPEVERALTILCDELGANFSPRRITLSTAGHVPGIKKLAESNLGVNLAVSLSATTDAVRDRIMPINRRWPIAELLQACREYPLPNRRRLTFEYVMLESVNDSDEDAARLVRLLGGIRCKINLIPFNATPDLPDRPSPRDRIEIFQKILHDAGLTATIRESRGRDISAACGMLKTDAEKKRTATAPVTATQGPKTD
ncbi:MAG: 23S rRNA (adenine(2503)-C(2))-methyltransferase RlmN [candidate division NC10 bacterium]|nr:23S rRNA (adenine(2503)-C(2))-methyltransferase RlmN [candidate division NC10 bacterium]